MTFVVPVSQNGKFTGVAGLDLKIDTLSKKILEMGKTKYGYVYLMNKDGLVLMHNDPNNVGKTIPSTKYLAEAFAAKKFDENGLIPYTNSKGENVTAKVVPKLAERTQKSLGEIEANANVLAQSINEMSESIREQTSAINMINESVAAIDNITRENISIVNVTNDVMAQIDDMAKVILEDVKKKKF